MSTSIGRGPAYGGNENHEGNPEHKTMGEEVKQEPPAGNDLLHEASPDVPAGVEGTRADPRGKLPGDKG